jgi:hypothetical protein
MENDAKAKPTLPDLMGQAPYTVTLKSLTDGHLEEAALAAPIPADFWEAKDFLAKERTKTLVADTAGLLDPDTLAKAIAETRQRALANTSVLIDQDGIQYMHFLMARRAGFKGNWDGFRKALQGSDIRKLQDGLFKLCDIRIDKKGDGSANPPESGTIAP